MGRDTGSTLKEILGGCPIVYITDDDAVVVSVGKTYLHLWRMDAERRWMSDPPYVEVDVKNSATHEDLRELPLRRLVEMAKEMVHGNG
jgi:hypothetical protein